MCPLTCIYRYNLHYIWIIICLVLKSMSCLSHQSKSKHFWYMPFAHVGWFLNLLSAGSSIFVSFWAKQLTKRTGLKHKGHNQHLPNTLASILLIDSLCLKSQKPWKLKLRSYTLSFNNLGTIPYRTFFKVFDFKVSSVLLKGPDIWRLKMLSHLENI